jgi:hypothetical protein
VTYTIINFIFSLFLFALLTIPIGLTASQESSDFPAYYVTAKRIEAGEAADVYVIEHQRAAGRKIFPINNPLVVEPPYALWAVAPMAWTSPQSAKVIYTCLLAILMSASLLITARIAQLTNWLTLVLIGAALASGPVFEIIRISKPIPLFLFGLVNCILCLQKKQEVRAGAWLVLCLFKPQEILPFLFFALGNRRSKLIVVCAVLGLAVVALTFPVFGSQGYVNFFDLLRYINVHPELPGTVMMPVLKGQLLRLSVSDHIASVVSNITYGAAILFALGLGWYKRETKNWWIPGAIASFACMAWTIPYMHLYDLIIFIPAICYLLQLLRQKKKTLSFGLVLVALSLFMQPIYSLVHYYYLTPHALVDLHFCALLLIGIIAAKEAILFKDAVSS